MRDCSARPEDRRDSAYAKHSCLEVCILYLRRTSVLELYNAVFALSAGTAHCNQARSSSFSCSMLGDLRVQASQGAFVSPSIRARELAPISRTQRSSEPRTFRLSSLTWHASGTVSDPLALVARRCRLRRAIWLWRFLPVHRGVKQTCRKATGSWSRSGFLTYDPVRSRYRLKASSPSSYSRFRLQKRSGLAIQEFR